MKVSFFEAAILIVAPVEGLRPSRVGDSFTLNLPKPAILVSAPLVAASEISLKTLSTIILACAFVIQWSPAILSAISLAVVMGRSSPYLAAPVPFDREIS